MYTQYLFKLTPALRIVIIDVQGDAINTAEDKLKAAYNFRKLLLLESKINFKIEEGRKKMPGDRIIFKVVKAIDIRD